MDVSYTVTEADLRAFLEWGTTQSPIREAIERSRVMGAGLFVLVALVFALVGMLGSGHVLYPVALVFAIAAVFAYLTFPARMRASYVKRSLAMALGGNTAYVLGPRAARISAEGFALSGPALSASYAWGIFDHVTWSASGVYLFVSGQQAHVIPSSAFSSAEELRRFAETAEAFRTAAPAA